MSSREIAELAGKQHVNVMRDIPALIADEARLTSFNFEGVQYREAKGDARPAYTMTRDGFMLFSTLSLPLGPSGGSRQMMRPATLAREVAQLRVTRATIMG